MKTFNLVFALCVAFLFSCNSNQEFKLAEKSIEKDSLVPLQRTVVADLPDSLQPKTFFLEDMPKPVVRAVPKSGGGTIMLPVLENEKGEPILDEEGNTILMGDGGWSDFTTFTTDDGLALDGVTCSIMDKFGNLWFGTERGVSRYDGKSFTNFSTAHGLTNNFVLNMIEDRSGNLWLLTVDGIVTKYDGQNFTNFTTKEGFESKNLVSIYEDKIGNLWFASWSDGVIKFDGQNFTNFTTKEGLGSNTIYNILEDKSGNLWFSSWGGGLSKYNGQSFTIYSKAHGLPNNNIYSMLEDKNGNLWAGSFDGEISYYNGHYFTSIFSGQGQANIIVRKITQDKEGNLWFSFETGGISRYNGKFLRHYSTTQGLPNSPIWSVSVDKSGSIWFGTYGGGVSRFNGTAFINFSKIHGLSHSSIRSITEDKLGNLWIGSDGEGVLRYDGKSFTTFSKEYGFSDFNVSSIIEDNVGIIWFGTVGNGVFCFDGLSFTHFTTAQGLASNYVQCITEDKNGNLWFGTSESGVSKFDGNSFTNFNSIQGLAHNNINRITQDKSGNFWFGTLGGGLSTYDGISFTNFTSTHGLASDNIWSIEEDMTGNLWFGTDQGLNFLSFESNLKQFPIINDSSGSSFQSNPANIDQVPTNSLEINTGQERISSSLFSSFGIADGLPDDVVTQIIQMPNEKMAIGTYLGITHFNISEDFSTLIDIEIFDSSTGYPIKDVNSGQNVMLLDSKGIIWAGTGSESTGLVRFDYEALNRSNNPPVVILQSIKIKDENVSWHTLSAELNNGKLNSEDSITTPAYITEEASLFGRELSYAERENMIHRFGMIEFDEIRPFYHLPENLVLPYNLNQVSFEFVAIETSRPQMIKYQYQLEGYDEDWRPVTNRSNATFGNIHEGNYTFKLKALGANGIWTEPVIYSFRVLPPWYRTWWAYVFYFFFLVGLVWRIHLIQKARTIRIEREKTKDKELAQAKEIEKAYGELGKAHQTLKSTQAQLIQSEKMASLGELTAGIAHEIQNPLNFVNNFSEVSAELVEEIQEARSKNEDKIDIEFENEILGDIKQNLEKINHHGKRADAIVKGMLEHSKTGSGVKELTDVNALAKEYLNLAHQGFKAKNKEVEIELITEFDKSLPRIEIVRSDIGKVLVNILNNAFYACTTPQPSRGLGTSSDEEAAPTQTVILKTTTVKSPSGDLGVKISISDNGPGIPDAIKDKIFQPFFTTKPTGQGTGLGLSLSYDIVKAHGGEITVKSKEGEGTEFTIQLPIV